MNTQELAAKVEATAGLNKGDGRKAVHAVFAEIASAIAAGDEVAVGGFGKFAMKQTAERDGRNPSTGEAIKIAAGKKATFSAAKGLKDRLSA